MKTVAAKNLNLNLMFLPVPSFRLRRLCYLYDLYVLNSSVDENVPLTFKCLL